MISGFERENLIPSRPRGRKIACVLRGLWRAMTETAQSLDDPAAAYARAVVRRIGRL